jgi:murein L,D-transpeptidase YcbB/YkuD
LAKYREIVENGGWPVIPEGETLKPGMKDERVAVMRKYLTITGDYNAEEPVEDDELFDERLEAAVKEFQLRHNLTQDGVVGKGTLAQMNVSVQERIDMIRINLERLRWIMAELEPDFLVVNIAGYNIRRLTHKETVYYSPVIVGKKYHKSPVFKGTMTYVVINPTWTVPYSIATKETLPKLQKDAGYLAEKNMVIMDRNGKILDPNTIDFSQYSRSNFPFTIRQEPGPQNALGQVKFMFPNKYAVYLHDTPARSLFSREDRAFSHGCIRLQKKWELLIDLMDDPEWNMDKINGILASEELTTVKLKKPIDILILYWTAGADQEGRLYFNRDVYTRDQALLEALDEPVSF